MNNINIKTSIISILFALTGIIFSGVNCSLKENRIAINKLQVEKMDKSEISQRLDRIEGYLIVVNKKNNQNDIYIEMLSEDVKDLKIMFTEYIK